MVELKKIQDNIYKIFVEFDRICCKYNIQYSMEGGTLLGAVKYQNFVPWDDDIDIIMRRDDYEKFIQVAPKEIDKNFFVQSFDNVKEFPLNYAKICLNGTKICNYDYSHLKNMNHGIFMDIFPIDNVIPLRLKRHCSSVGVFTSARKVKLGVKLRAKGIKKVIFNILSLLPLQFLTKKVKKNCTKYNKERTGYRYEVCNSNKNFPPMPAEMYDEYIELEFRGKKFKAVKEYDKLLKSRFGEDYMDALPPVEKRKPSHNQNIIFEEEFYE